MADLFFSDVLLPAGWAASVRLSIASAGSIASVTPGREPRGRLGPADPRSAGTVEAVETTLSKGPPVYRDRADDGLPGAEGGFHICASWLVDAYVLLGRVDDARQLFEQIIALAGPTGLLSEQYGPRTGRALGNVPQPYSHIGIIENAIRPAGVARLSER